LSWSLCLWVPHCTSGTVSFHISNEFHDIYQFLLLCDHMLILCQWICLDASREFWQGSVTSAVKQNHVYCVIWSAFLLVLSVLLYVWSLCYASSVLLNVFLQACWKKFGKLCSVFYLGHFNATRDVAQVRYQLPLWHCMNAVNFSHNDHLYSGTCASEKMVNQIPKQRNPYHVCRGCWISLHQHSCLVGTAVRRKTI